MEFIISPLFRTFMSPFTYARYMHKWLLWRSFESLHLRSEHMGAIKGADYINRINQLNNEVWFDGKKVEGLLSEFPAFKELLRIKASLYDLQHDPKIKEEMTYISPLSGERVGLSFLQPKTGKKPDIFSP